jgi:pyruvate dehydrogenase E2 component (dihydrolipoamide acetyltransferase)
MAISVVMPALEMAQETGKLVSWLKKEGESVAKGELLLEVETDKAVMEIESPGSGILAGVTATPGMEVAVGRTIAWIVQPGEAPPKSEEQAAPGARRGVAEVAARSQPTPTAQNASPSSQTSEARISPKARRLAKEHGVDVATLQGTGAGGEILAADILAAAGSGKRAENVSPSSAPASAPASTNAVSHNVIAKIMAERTAQSWTTVPHFFVTRELDASPLNRLRESLAAQTEKSHGVRATHTDLLVYQVARALAVHPQLNASWIEGSVRHNPEINIAIAVAVDGGVVAPVIHNAGKLTIGEIAVRRKELAERARGGKLRPADIAGGTFTISNLGMLDVDSFTAIITPPQAAILAVGRITDRVAAVDGKPAVVPMMTLTLSSDHRVLDGAVAARFMQTLAGNLAQTKLAEST